MQGQYLKTGVLWTGHSWKLKCTRTVLFSVTTKNIKYLDVNLTKCALQDLSAKNKPLKKGI